MDRRKALFAAQTEEDLLAQQEEFMRESGLQPATRVTRIQRKPVAAENGQQPQQPTPPPKPKPAISSGFLPTNIGHVLGNIKERGITDPLPPPSAPIAAPAPGRYFPRAAHRKQSKFALSRKAGTVPAAATTTAPSQPAPFSSSPLAAASGSVPRQGSSAQSEAASMSAENEQALAAMGVEGRAEAVEDLRSRMSPQTLAFLANRGKKAAAAGAPSQPTPSAGKEHSSAVAAPATAAAAAASSNQAGGSHTLAPGFLLKGQQPTRPASAAQAHPTLSNSSLCAPFGSGLQHQQVAEQGGSRPYTEEDQVEQQQGQWPQGTQTGAQSQQAVDPRLVARLRFDLGGDVVGVQAEDEVWSEQAMLQRDQLRQDEGSAPQGYNISELLLLARSSLTNHRVAALQMLAAVLAKARPSPLDVGPQGQLAATRLVNGVQSAVEEMQLHKRHSTTTISSSGSGSSNNLDSKGSKISSSNSVAWVQVWDYAVRELGVASHIRLALDDRSPGVCAAAAAAAAALTSPGPEEALTAEASHCCCGLGWPGVWAGMVSRPQAAGTWQARRAVAPEIPGAAGQGVVVPGVAGDEEETPEDVGTLDPVGGLMRMQVLPRLRYLLEVVQLRGAPAGHCLRVMCACAVHSEEAAMVVLRCPRLLGVIQTLLLPGALHPSDQSVTNASVEVPSSIPQEGGHMERSTTQKPSMSSSNTGMGYGDGGGADDGSGLQLMVMLLLRLLCQASSMCAQLVRSSGVLPLVQGHLVMGCAVSEPRSVDLLKVIEALRLWRVCAVHGVPSFSFDSLYPQLAGLFLPPSPPASPSAVFPAAAEANPAGSPSNAPPSQPESLLSQQPQVSAASTLPPTSLSSTMGRAQHAQLRLQQRDQYLQHLLRWHVTREVLALIDALVAHALSVDSSQAGHAHLGQPMLTPGAAAALAAEAGRLWLGRDILRRVAESSVGRPEQRMLAADRDQWLQWHGSGTHPTLLLPPSFVLTSCLAAALRFLATYWSSVQSKQQGVSLGSHGNGDNASGGGGHAAEVPNGSVPGSETQQHESAQGGPQCQQQQQQQQQQGVSQAQAAASEVRGFLSRSGLLCGLVSGVQAINVASYTPSSAHSPRDALALLLLSAPAGSSVPSAEGQEGGSSTHSSHIGSALMGVWVEHACGDSSSMTLSSVGRPQVSQPGAAGSALAVCERWCCQAAASDSVSATLSLGMVLQQPTLSTHTNKNPAYSTTPAHTSSPSSSQAALPASFEPGCRAGSLACTTLPRLALAVSALAKHHALSGCNVMGPWHLAAMQAMQPAVRLLLLLARISDHVAAQQSLQQPQAPPSSAPTYYPSSITEPLSTAVAVIDAALAVLTLSPPGAETQCLDALRHATSPRRLEQVLPGLLACFRTMHSQNLNLFAAAAGISVRVPAMRAASCTLPVGSTASNGSSSPAPGPNPAASTPPAAEPMPAATAAPKTAPPLAAPPPSPSSSTAAAAAARAPYPPPATLHAPSLSLILFDGYAAAWLSMIAAQRVEGDPAETTDRDNQARSASRRVFHIARGGPYVDAPDGSRLPCPHTWMISECLMLPANLAKKKPQQQQVRQQQQAVHPVGAALALVAALELARPAGKVEQQQQQQEQQSGCQQQRDDQQQSMDCHEQSQESQLPASIHNTSTPVRTAQCLQATLHACFVYDARQLLSHADRVQRGKGAMIRGAGSVVNEEEAEATGGAWGDGLARWALAALTGIWALLPPLTPAAHGLSKAGNDPARMQTTSVWSLPCFPPVTWCTPLLAEKLASQFGTASFGDPLFGALLAPLLLPGTVSAVVRALWSGLTQEQAVHLLPPASRCLGQPSQYLATPHTHPDVVSMLLRSVCANEVHKALALGSVAGDVALLAVLNQVCSSRYARDTLEGAPAHPTPGVEAKATHQQAGLAARSLVRSLTVGHLKDVIEAGERLGWPKHVLHCAFKQGLSGEQELAGKLAAVFELR